MTTTKISADPIEFPAEAPLNAPKSPDPMKFPAEAPLNAPKSPFVFSFSSVRPAGATPTRSRGKDIYTRPIQRPDG